MRSIEVCCARASATGTGPAKWRGPQAWTGHAWGCQLGRPRQCQCPRQILIKVMPDGTYRRLGAELRVLLLRTSGWVSPCHTRRVTAHQVQRHLPVPHFAASCPHSRVLLPSCTRGPCRLPLRTHYYCLCAGNGRLLGVCAPGPCAQLLPGRGLFFRVPSCRCGVGDHAMHVFSRRRITGVLGFYLFRAGP